MIEQVRRFNRTVTQRIGALDDAFLARDRPLGQARLLWEIGPDGIDVRRLRARLELDSGYLSRLLRSLAGDDLVSVEPSEADGRVRTARLTLAGRAEQAELDRLSDDAAAALLEPLSPRQRDRLLTAMAEVERLLLASAIQIGGCDPRHRTRAARCRPIRPSCRPDSRRASTRPGASRPPTRRCPRPRGCSCSPPCTPSRSGAGCSNSTRARPLISSACGSPARFAGWGWGAGCWPNWRLRPRPTAPARSSWKRTTP